jgi:hypothetical protein
MKKHILTFIGFLLLKVFCFSQSSQLDSLLTSRTQDSSTVKLLNELFLSMNIRMR